MIEIDDPEPSSKKTFLLRWPRSAIGYQDGTRLAGAEVELIEDVGEQTRE